MRDGVISEKELRQAIAECEKNIISFQGCEKLAALYTVYDHLYGQPIVYADMHTEPESVIEAKGDNEFFRAIDGKNAEKVWGIMSELMESVKLIQPRLYDAVMQKIQE